MLRVNLSDTIVSTRTSLSAHTPPIKPEQQQVLFPVYRTYF